MDSEDISSLCASLSISDRDVPIQLLNEKLMIEAKHRLSLCIVGKIFSSNRVNRDAFMRVIGKIWQVRKGMDIESVTGNTFSFHFKDAYDLERVLAGGPWSFDNALLVMDRPVGKGTIESLRFSEVIEVDGGASGDCVGKFMRVRVRVNIEKSLARCLRVDILGDGVISTMILRYERLPNHCFKCGMVNHITPECSDMEPVLLVDGKGRSQHDANFSIVGSSSHRHDNLMETGNQSATEVNVLQKQCEVDEVLMSNGTERGAINAKEVEEVECNPSNMGDSEMDRGSMSKGPEDISQGDGSVPIACLYADEVKGNFSFNPLKPNSSIGPVEDPALVVTRPNILPSSNLVFEAGAIHKSGPKNSRVWGVLSGDR
ncbi:hypothetical protein EZV62_004088 [Acer yangbiense]|uniref:DUF4283 domain-containing protein n=1 Tax=Acer yangbiense TaxID=1000413 RepID=A0A5C7IIR7_9ROSI|nr:hypothetical protein EZV62_004088 [Acer yangbiense]